MHTHMHTCTHTYTHTHTHMHTHTHTHIICTQVAAQTGHSVCLVDVSREILQNAEDRIQTSIKRVAKKMFAEEPKVCYTAICRL